MVFDILLYLVWIALLIGVSTAIFQRLARKQFHKARVPVRRQEARRPPAGRSASR